MHDQLSSGLNWEPLQHYVMDIVNHLHVIFWVDTTEDHITDLQCGCKIVAAARLWTLRKNRAEFLWGNICWTVCQQQGLIKDTLPWISGGLFCVIIWSRKVYDGGFRSGIIGLDFSLKPLLPLIILRHAVKPRNSPLLHNQICVPRDAWMFMVGPSSSSPSQWRSRSGTPSQGNRVTSVERRRSSSSDVIEPQETDYGLSKLGRVSGDFEVGFLSAFLNN